MASLMKPTDFDKMFAAALTDKKFQDDLRTHGFKALDDRKFQHGVPPHVQKNLEQALFTGALGTMQAKPRCGVCGVCGICGLCGEVNFGSASAALWALFGLAATAV